MSTFRVPVVKLGKVGKHPNADSLSITTIEGGPCIFRTGDFKEGDIAVYIPVDAVVPETVPGTEFLGKHRRIKAVKLRGIFSMGLLLSPYVIKPDPESANYPAIGDDVANLLGITKYEEPEPLWMKTETAAPPKLKTQAPVYDVESYRKYKNVFIPDERVIVTEKLHGTNSRFVFTRDPETGVGELHAGSHRTWKKFDERNIWWRMARKYDLSEKLESYPGLILYGETFGANVQDFSYNFTEPEFRAFDAYDSNSGHWMDWVDFQKTMYNLDIPIVPILYEGPYHDRYAIEGMEKGASRVNKWHMQEGLVVKPTRERWDNQIGRVILKLVSEDYLTRKGGSEHH